MPSKLDQIIDISISLSTKTIATQGFGIPMIAGISMKLDRRAKSYASIDEVGEDFAEEDTEYKMAQAEFSQELVPDSVIIGKKVVLASTAVTSATRVASSGADQKRATIVVADSNAEVGASAVFTGFSTSEYNATTTIVERVDVDTFVVEYASALSNSSASGSGSVVISETWSSALQKIYDYNSSWYCAHITSNVAADILSAAGKIEALKRLLIVRSSDADNKDSASTTSILYQLKALSYDRTSLIYNADTTTKFIDAAWGGRMLPTIPGSENWAFKTLKGVAADDLQSGYSSAILNNNGNTYETFAGRGITRFGRVVSGEYIDIIRGADWLQARLQENLFLLLINSEKVEFEDSGISKVQSNMSEVFEQAVANGLIKKNKEGKGIYTILVPDDADISTSDKLARFLSGVTFSAELAGAINKIGIRGNLSV
jgi:hypothetical protein